MHEADSKFVISAGKVGKKVKKYRLIFEKHNRTQEKKNWIFKL